MTTTAGSLPLKLRLEVRYRTPSLNLTKRRHWSAQRRERHRAWAKLLCALQDIAAGCSTRTISPDQLRTSLMAVSRLASSMTIARITSSSLPSRKKSPTSKTK